MFDCKGYLYQNEPEYKEELLAVLTKAFSDIGLFSTWQDKKSIPFLQRILDRIMCCMYHIYIHKLHLNQCNIIHPRF